MLKMLVGLGNPGPEYEETRHNAGFWYLDMVAQQARAVWRADRSFHGMVAKADMSAGMVWLLKPQTFMNLSGKSVAALARFYKILPQEILVAHDELDIAPGEAKIKQGGGHAGHNGLRDIHAQLGSGDYWRLRLGVGHPGHKAEVAGWVLRKPPLDEKIAIEQAMQRGLTALPALLAGDMAQAMKWVHTSKPPREKKALVPPAGNSVL